MKRILALLLLLMSTSAWAVFSGPQDPSVVATDAPAGSVYIRNTNGAVYTKLDNGLTTLWSLAGGGGTVSSVGLSLPNIFSVAGSPVTGSGTLSASFVSEAANSILSGPVSGGSAAPSFRSLVSADIPPLPYVSSSAAQLANSILAGPTSGGPVSPSFRALVAADIPALPYASSALTSGNIFVGNGSNVATGVAMSGDAAISNSGVVSMPVKNNTTLGTANGLSVTGQTLSLSVMGGANGSVGGSSGAVPAPAATDNVNFLRGDGTWAATSSGISGLTTNQIPKATSPTTIGNSSISDNGSLVTMIENTVLNALMNINGVAGQNSTELTVTGSPSGSLPASLIFGANYSSVLAADIFTTSPVAHQTGSTPVTGGYLDMSVSGSTSEVDYDFGNTAFGSSGSVGAVRFHIVRSTDAATFTALALSKTAANTQDVILIRQVTSPSNGTLTIRMGSDSSTLFIDDSTNGILGVDPATVGTDEEWELDFDLTIPAVRFFVNGTQLGSTIVPTSPSRVNISGGSANFIIGNNGIPGSMPPNAKYAHYYLFNAVQHTTNYSAPAPFYNGPNQVADVFDIKKSDGTLLLGASYKNLNFNNIHLKSTQTAAPTATVNSNAGTGATCTVSSATDVAGTINLTTTATAPSAGDQCDVNFSAAYGVAPVCVLSAASGNSSLFVAADGIYVSSTTARVSVNFQNADAIGRSFVLNYYCTETQ
jgi:hypothetical protein